MGSEGWEFDGSTLWRRSRCWERKGIGGQHVEGITEKESYRSLKNNEGPAGKSGGCKKSVMQSCPHLAPQNSLQFRCKIVTQSISLDKEQKTLKIVSSRFNQAPRQ